MTLTTLSFRKRVEFIINYLLLVDLDRVSMAFKLATNKWPKSTDNSVTKTPNLTNNCHLQL